MDWSAWTISSNPNNNDYRFLWDGELCIKSSYIYEKLIPTRIIFNNRATICYFPDGDKVVVKCSPNEKFVEEVGVTEAIVRKLFKGNRSAFLKLVENAYRQPEKEE